MDELCATGWKAPDLPGHVCNQWRNTLVWRLEPVTLHVDILQEDHHWGVRITTNLSPPFISFEATYSLLFNLWTILERLEHRKAIHCCVQGSIVDWFVYLKFVMFEKKSGQIVFISLCISVVLELPNYGSTKPISSSRPSNAWVRQLN